MGKFLLSIFSVGGTLLQLVPVLLLALVLLSFRAVRAGVGFLAVAIVAGYFLATPAAADTLLHFPQTFWDEINDLVIGLFVALLTLGWKWIDAHSPLKNTQAEALARAAFQDLLDKAAQYGLTQLKAAETKVGTIDVGNAAIAAGANFAIVHGPDLAKKMGVDITTDEGRAAIIRSVTLRVGVITGSDAGQVIRTQGDSTLAIPQKAQPAPIPLPASVSLAGAPAPAPGVN